jgi:hypothetical protein
MPGRDAVSLPIPVPAVPPTLLVSVVPTAPVVLGVVWSGFALVPLSRASRGPQPMTIAAKPATSA